MSMKTQPLTAVGYYFLCTHFCSFLLKTSAKSHDVPPGVGKSTCTCTTLRLQALIEQLMLPSLHQSCLPGDTNGSMLKILFPCSSLVLPPCLCVSLCPCVQVYVRFTQEEDSCNVMSVKQTQCIIKENSIRSYLLGSKVSEAV